MKLPVIVGVVGVLLMLGLGLWSRNDIYESGIQQGRYLEQQDFYAEAINAGVGEFGPDGAFRFKKP